LGVRCAALRYQVIATFGRADVAGKAMQFALGEDHGVVITTPADYPDPAPEATVLTCFSQRA